MVFHQFNHLKTHPERWDHMLSRKRIRIVLVPGMMIITMAISKKGDVKVPPTDDVPKKKLHFYRMSRPGPHPFWWKPE